MKDRNAVAVAARLLPKGAVARPEVGCEPVLHGLSGFEGAWRAPPFERHLVFDNVLDPSTAGPREQFEALGRSVRDRLSVQWIATENAYLRVNPKRAYYLSMEFLIGRALANNVSNLLLDRDCTIADKALDWSTLLEQEPDAGLGNGGLGRLAACFLDSAATLQLPSEALARLDSIGTKASAKA